MGRLLSTGLLLRNTVALCARRLLGRGDLGVGATALLALSALGRVGRRGRGLGSRVGRSLGRIVTVSSGGESSMGDADVSNVGGGRPGDASDLSRGGGDGSEELRHGFGVYNVRCVCMKL